jgi:hypothetical protein
VEAITLRNTHGVAVRIIALGASIQTLMVPDRNGKPADVVLGYANLGASWRFCPISPASSFIRGISWTGPSSGSPAAPTGKATHSSSSRNCFRIRPIGPPSVRLDYSPASPT